MTNHMFKVTKIGKVWILVVKGFNYPMRYSSLEKLLATVSELSINL